MDSSQVMQKSILSNYIARIKAERDRDIEKAKFEFIYEEFKKLKENQIKKLETKGDEDEDIRIILIKNNEEINTIKQMEESRLEEIKNIIQNNHRELIKENKYLKQENQLLLDEIKVVKQKNQQINNNLEQMKLNLTDIHEQIKKENSDTSSYFDDTNASDISSINQDKSSINQDRNQKGHPQKTRNIWHAAKMGRLQAVKFWLRKNPNLINETENDTFLCSPLHFAAQKGHIEIVKYLIKSGAQIEFKNLTGTTPLHWAAQNGHLEIVKILISHGADPNSKNKKSKRPINCAQQYSHREVVEYLNSFK